MSTQNGCPGPEDTPEITFEDDDMSLNDKIIVAADISAIHGGFPYGFWVGDEWREVSMKVRSRIRTGDRAAVLRPYEVD